MVSSLGGSTGLRGGSQGDIVPKGFRKGQLQNYTPQQMQLHGQQFEHVGPQSYLSKLARGDQSQFEEMEAPTHRGFQGQLGQLATRFSGKGSGGRRSSGFQNAATSAASNFQQDLQSNRQNLQRQAINDLMGLSNTLLGQRPQDQFITEKQQKPNYWGQIVGSLAGQVPGAIASYATGGASNAAKGGYDFLSQMQSGAGYNY